MRKSGPKMKLTHQRMTGRCYDNTPESVLDWLEEQLEYRGIDAVVYTRYILSLLQDYDTDEDDEELSPKMTSRDRSGFCCEPVVKRHNCYNSYVKDNIKPVTTTKWKHKRYLKQTDISNTGCYLDCWPHYHYCPQYSLHSERKLAVVQCLKSASEQELGIESFVDELCAKLKNIKLLSEPINGLTTESKSEIISSADGVKVSPKEQAMKYYAAFPALDNNCNECPTLISKPETDINLRQESNRLAFDRNKWNGKKIIEFINGNICSNGLSPDSNNSSDYQINDNKCEEYVNRDANDKQNRDKEMELNVKTVSTEQNESNVSTNLYFCRDIENNVFKSGSPLDGLGASLVDNQCLIDGITEDTKRFERLVNKFNRNIASIWSTTTTDSILNKNDNIWSFDSSFSSNQSSATPSPKINSKDLWSFSIKEMTESLSDKRESPLNCWPITVFKSLNLFSDDGFIDGNYDIFDDDINWYLNGTDQTMTQTNRTSLQNHQKNSPFVEFNTILSSNGNNCDKDSDFSGLLSMAPFLSPPKVRTSPQSGENLLTSSKTHFQPIKQDSLDRDESDEGSIADLTDREVNKLLICSNKCPNNGENKLKDSSDFHRPISTSFGELASYMGPFNDLELNCSQYSQELVKSEYFEITNCVKECQMSDKSTNTETDVNQNANNDLKTRLSSIVETESIEPCVEVEPEYQDLYDMINEILRNGISEEMGLNVGTPSLTLTDDCNDSNDTHLSDDMSGSDREKSVSYNGFSDSNDFESTERQFSESEISDKRVNNNSELNSTDCTFDEVFAKELYFKNITLFDECDDYVPQNNIDCAYSQTSVEDQTRAVPMFNSQLNLQFKSRNNEKSGRLRKPCSFFIEGNCKRSDCKYSHEINGITCKYWEEGFCFKADLCPFLHGYLNEVNEFQTDFSSLERSKSYAIESESDFPSLSTFNLNNEDLIRDNCADSLENRFFDFETKSVVYNGTIGTSKTKLPIAVFMKKKVKKRKDRNLQ